MNTQLTQLHCRRSRLSSFQFCSVGACAVRSVVGYLLKRSVERGRVRRQSKKKVKSLKSNQCVKKFTKKEKKSSALWIWGNVNGVKGRRK